MFTFIIGATNGLLVVVPGATEDDDPVELAVPEQFSTSYKDGKLTTTPTAHV